MTDEPLYNSRIINSYVKLIKRKYRQVDLDELLLYAGITLSEVNDEEHWFTQVQVDRFYEKLTQTLGGVETAREAGRYAATGESLGLLGKYLLGMMGPANAFFTIGKTSSRMSKSSICTSRKIDDNKVEITVTPVPGGGEKAYQCENRTGFYESILMMFDYDLPVIEHPECLFKGGGCCRYLVTWKKTPYARLKLARNWLTAALLAVCAVLAPFYPWMIFTCALPSLVTFFLGCSYFSERLGNRELTRALTNLKESSDRLLDQVGTNYNNARLVNEVGQAISKQSDIDEVLASAIAALSNELSYDRYLIMLADQNKSNLVFRGADGYSDEQLATLKQRDFSLTGPGPESVFVTCFREQKALLVDDIPGALPASRTPYQPAEAEAQSFMCCPIVCEGESLGVLSIDNFHTKKKLVQSDLNLIMEVAPVIGMNIRNAMHTDRERRMAEELRQSQKMEAVGQLAGGIAHDFNNLLTAIIGFATLTQMKMAEDDPSVRNLEQIISAADRAANLTQGLLAFSRKQVSNPEPVDLNSIVADIRKLLKRLISAEIELDISVCQERLLVEADSSQIGQIMMNLATNACDAMDGKGVLSIATCAVDISDDFVRTRGLGAVGRYALLSVRDTGAGMDQATKAHVFEPFFTTKEVGKGTGLGLAIIYGIVQQHEGFCGIDSEPGAGTTFNIYLPLLVKEPTVSRRPAEVMPVFCTGTETVLVAEDAPEVRKLTVQVLEQNGYRVIEATNGQDAVHKFHCNIDKVDLVIMDVIMPVMNGKEAFSKIAQASPRMKVLFTSGYTPDDAQREGDPFGKANFLPKPSSPQALLKKVRELLAA